MGLLKIERVGGLAGFGGPHLKSRGEVDFAKLPATDQARIEKLFAGGSKPAPTGTGDMFRYRITRTLPGGEQTIEVPSDMIPAMLVNSVHDTLE
jgi:hypothetical protein